MKATGAAVVLWGFALGPAAAAGPLEVVCTLPTLAALVREVGGDRVAVTALSRGDQDPHFVSPTPSLMKKTRQADLFVELGLSLDLWADEVANGAGNPKILRGQPGRLVASDGVPVLEVPPVLSREFGDIHPQGNPHLWLDPLRAKRLAANIARALQGLRPGDAALFAENLERFDRRIDEALFGRELLELVGAAKLERLVFDGKLGSVLDSEEVDGRPLRQRLGGWLAKAAPLRGVPVVEFHKVWIYFARVFGLEIVGQIEERPGIPPGPQHQREIIELVRSRGVPLILVDNFYDPRLPEFVASQSGARVVLLPNQVGGEPGVEDYFALIDRILDELLEALPSARGGP
jgi:ABC-type Zn uptake system ZnuABC Zn-binding protein ZnuA